MVFKSLPNSPEIHFVTDRYMPDSIKETERIRRGDSDSNSFIIRGALTKLPKNWKQFLSNGENKIALTKLILQQWETDSYASHYQGRKIYFVCEETCTLLSSEDGFATDTQPEVFFRYW